jgi:hypothetical protein
MAGPLIKRVMKNREAGWPDVGLLGSNPTTPSTFVCRAPPAFSLKHSHNNIFLKINKAEYFYNDSG